MKEITFTKMHGLGNDYIYIDCTESCPSDPGTLSKEMSPRHTAVGSDGIILILPSSTADFKMRIFNADGSEAKMCGNGSRCVGKYVYDHALTAKKTITLETLSGVKHLFLNVGDDGKVDTVAVDMGKPVFESELIPVTSDGIDMIDRPVVTSLGTFRLTAVSMGNPHGVIFVEDVDNIDIEKTGAELENHPMWPDRANIEFARVISDDHIVMRVWERGSGETMACGTGACAVAAAAIATGRVKNDVTVSLKGGDLSVRIDDRGHLIMTGPAAEVFTGVYQTHSD